VCVRVWPPYVGSLCHAEHELVLQVDIFTRDEFRWSQKECALVPSVFYLGFTMSRLLCATVALRLLSSTSILALMLCTVAWYSLASLPLAMAHSALPNSATFSLVFVSLFHSGVGLFVSVGVFGFGLGPLFALALGMLVDLVILYTRPFAHSVLVSFVILCTSDERCALRVPHPKRSGIYDECAGCVHLHHDL
jgi:hypothetical protein